MLNWLFSVFHRPRESHEREASAVRLAKLDSEADFQVQRARNALDEWDRIKGDDRLGSYRRVQLPPRR